MTHEEFGYALLHGDITVGEAIAIAHVNGWLETK